jgi:hypothetical protein
VRVLRGAVIFSKKEVILEKGYFEESVEKKSDEVFVFLSKYLYTFKSFLFNPKETFKRIKSGEHSEKYLAPRVFLLLNLLLANTFGLLLGFKLPEVPAITLSTFQKYLTNASFLILSYVFGYFVFVSIFRSIMNRISEKLVKTNQVILMVSYASVVFVPFVFAEKIGHFYFGTHLINKLSILKDANITDTEITFHLKDLWKLGDFLVLFIPAFLLMFYWCFLLFIAMKAFGFDKRLRILVATLLLFFVSRAVSSVFLFVLMLAPSSESLYLLNHPEVDLSKGTKEVNYFIVARIQERISEDEKIKRSVRYYLKLSSIGFLVELSKPKTFDGLALKNQDLLKNGKPEEAYKSLKEAIEKMKNDNVDDDFSKYQVLLSKLDEAVSIKNNLDKNEEIYWRKTGMLKDVSPMINLHLVSMFSIFPISGNR